MKARFCGHMHIAPGQRPRTAISTVVAWLDSTGRSWNDDACDKCGRVWRFVSGREARR